MSGNEYPNIDPYGGGSVKMPSERVAPTRSESAHQQASTGPGDGKRIDANRVPLKEQIKGYAKITQGAVTGNKDAKEIGHDILHGKAQ